MAKFKQFEDLQILDFEAEVFEFPMHSQNYYELMYIFSGKGLHWLNGHSLEYESGSFFLISSEDEHWFDIHDKTSFTAIKFTDDYFAKWESSQIQGFKQISERIMRNRLLKEMRLFIDEPNNALFRTTMKNIQSFHPRKNASGSLFVFHQILSLFGLIEENLPIKDIPFESIQSQDKLLVSYIHQNIYFPEKLRIKVIADLFNIAESYFGMYFKRNFGMRFQDYTSEYKIALINKRLKSGSQTIKEIAEEFGFCDESHLSHFYKSRTNKTPVFQKKGMN